MRLRALSEAECYCRCYGSGDSTVNVVRVERVHERHEPRLAAERFRRLLEQRVAVREPALAALEAQ
jgi:hypothetical protein